MNIYERQRSFYVLMFEEFYSLNAKLSTLQPSPPHNDVLKSTFYSMGWLFINCPGSCIDRYAFLQMHAEHGGWPF